MNLKIELLFSDAEFECWKIGLWEFTRTRDGEAFWIWRGMSQKPQPDSRERLGEAISQEKLPKRCNLHPRPCWYDGAKCPCCSAEKELLALTEEE